MKWFEFSFEREPVWMVVLSIASGIVGLLILLFVVLFR